MILYLDCYSGLSGDMVLGALLDLGIELDDLARGLATLGLEGYRLEAHQETRQGLRGTRALVEVEPRVPRPERNLADITTSIARSGLSEGVKAHATAVFARLARAEAKVHGLAVEAVHFHEVGAVDSILDIVGAALGLELLGVQQVYASPVPLGAGLVSTRHGLLPVPAPATLELLAEVHAPTRASSVEVELVTPTGAALLAELARFEPPALRLERVGYGFGTRALPWPNAVRAWLGQPLEPTGAFEEEVVVLESNLDNMTPEQAGYVLERLLAAGALDVFFVPLQTKKSRPGLLLGVIATPGSARALAELVLRETPTLGVRMRATGRLVAPRTIEQVQTELGPAHVKVKRLGQERFVVPEYEDAARLARKRQLPLAEVYRLIREAARRDFGF
ncbi:MAG: nickel pincer cofactor biosynthesis protein LarC [Chloroflexi bacterium]|nr:nickel pincer cofactor biosynthesis protein LarC [Chloroflexota bacterium]